MKVARKVEVSYEIDQGANMTRHQAKEWLDVAAQAGHGGSCYCRPCEIARKRLRPKLRSKSRGPRKWIQLSLPFPEDSNE